MCARVLLFVGRPLFLRVALISDVTMRHAIVYSGGWYAAMRTPRPSVLLCSAVSIGCAVAQMHSYCARWSSHLISMICLCVFMCVMHLFRTIAPFSRNYNGPPLLRSAIEWWKSIESSNSNSDPVHRRTICWHQQHPTERMNPSSSLALAWHLAIRAVWTLFEMKSSTRLTRNTWAI